MKRCPGGVRCRYLFACIAAAAMAITSGLNTQFFVTIIFMGNHTAVNSTIGNATCGKDGPFTYSVNTRNLLIGAYFWGYAVSQVPGGRFAETVSAKWTVFASVVLNIICTALIPYFARINIQGVFAMRILQGLAGGVLLPSLHTMIARWAPTNERSTIGSIIYGSGSLGVAVSLLASYGINTRLGWEYVFYVMAALCGPWLIFWIIFVTDFPQKHPGISDREETYLQSVIHTQQPTRYVPVKSILKSKPFWGIFVAHISSGFTWFSIKLTLPLYIVQMFAFKYCAAVYFSALVFFCMFLFSISLGITLDVYFIKKRKKSATLTRNLGTWTALLLPAICLIIRGNESKSPALAIVMTVFTMTFLGGKYSGFFISHIDIAPNYAGTLMGVTNMFATIPAILISVLAEMLINYRPVLDSWKLIYIPNIVLLLVSAMVHSAFGSSEEQPWNAIIALEEGNEK